jgi:3-hydroxyanthranilate 3,4-dioxygenase
MVIECKRTANERDGLMWFCDNCNEPLHDTYFQLTNVEKDFQPRFKEFYSSEDKRTCNNCGNTMEVDKRFI